MIILNTVVAVILAILFISALKESINFSLCLKINKNFFQIALLLELIFLVYMESTTRLGQEDWRKKLERPETEVSQVAVNL